MATLHNTTQRHKYETSQQWHNICHTNTTHKLQNIFKLHHTNNKNSGTKQQITTENNNFWSCTYQHSTIWCRACPSVVKTKPKLNWKTKLPTSTKKQVPTVFWLNFHWTPVTPWVQPRPADNLRRGNQRAVRGMDRWVSQSFQNQIYWLVHDTKIATNQNVPFWTQNAQNRKKKN